MLGGGPPLGYVNDGWATLKTYAGGGPPLGLRKKDREKTSKIFGALRAPVEILSQNSGPQSRPLNFVPAPARISTFLMGKVVFSCFPASFSHF